MNDKLRELPVMFWLVHDDAFTAMKYSADAPIGSGQPGSSIPASGWPPSKNAYRLASQDVTRAYFLAAEFDTDIAHWPDAFAIASHRLDTAPWLPIRIFDGLEAICGSMKRLEDKQVLEVAKHLRTAHRRLNPFVNRPNGSPATPTNDVSLAVAQQMKRWKQGWR